MTKRKHKYQYKYKSLKHLPREMLKLKAVTGILKSVHENENLTADDYEYENMEITFKSWLIKERYRAVCPDCLVEFFSAVCLREATCLNGHTNYFARLYAIEEFHLTGNLF